MTYRSKTFKKENFFILYDINDNIVSYFDNFEELSKVLKYELMSYNTKKFSFLNVLLLYVIITFPDYFIDGFDSHMPSH